jgi:hypothetical protein
VLADYLNDPDFEDKIEIPAALQVSVECPLPFAALVAENSRNDPVPQKSFRASTGR